MSPVIWEPESMFDRPPGNVGRANGWKYQLQKEPSGWDVLAFPPGATFGQALDALDPSISWGAAQKRSARAACERHAAGYRAWLDGLSHGVTAVWAWVPPAWPALLSETPRPGILYHALPQTAEHRAMCGLVLPHRTRYVEGEPQDAPMLCAQCRALSVEWELRLPGIDQDLLGVEAR